MAKLASNGGKTIRSSRLPAYPLPADREEMFPCHE